MVQPFKPQAKVFLLFETHSNRNQCRDLNIIVTDQAGREENGQTGPVSFQQRRERQHPAQEEEPAAPTAWGQVRKATSNQD